MRLLIDRNGRCENMTQRATQGPGSLGRHVGTEVREGWASDKLPHTLQASPFFHDGRAVLLPLGKVSKCNQVKLSFLHCSTFTLCPIFTYHHIPLPHPTPKGTSPTPKSIERITGIPEVSRGRNSIQGVCSIYITAGTLKGALRSLSLPYSKVCMESLQLFRQAAPIF